MNRRLRPAGHFDPRNVEERRLVLPAAGHVKAVNEHADRLLEAALLAGAEAADGDDLRRDAVGNVQIGYRAL